MLLSLYIGKFKRLTFMVMDPATASPIDITTAQFAFTVKRNKQDLDSSAIISKGLSSGISVVNGPAGQGQVDIFANDTIDQSDAQDIPIYWDLQMTLSGNPEILAAGTGTLAVPVTRGG